MNEELVKQLRDDISLSNDIHEDLAERRAAFEESCSDILKISKEVSDRIMGNKSLLTSEAIEEYKESGNKKLLGGIGIRETNKLIYDSEKALSFAKEKKMFLSLDKKSFEKVAASLDLDFVESKKEIKVTFPKVIKL